VAHGATPALAERKPPVVAPSAVRTSVLTWRPVIRSASISVISGCALIASSTSFVNGSTPLALAMSSNVPVGMS
jgi:hypothetical protein